ncbi:kinase-like protein [Piromyces finnis]|uniref:non-specific serine/threonine protein kinase n=1 Tax=Piromyces finnis TaxID=1754191 RepID=A0A1Y1VHV9_9FUNG|nr:kinase-like protein [Piromyces finnis]|eukprot:ORX56610.1 kinase-like protein [Piromyces finnis]
MVTQPSLPKELDSIKNSLENNINNDSSKVNKNGSLSRCEMGDRSINDTHSIHSIHSIRINDVNINDDARSCHSIHSIRINDANINDDALSIRSNKQDDGEEKDVINTLENTKKATSEYISYLLLCQKHSSSNFIHKIDSKEILWNDESIVVKMIGPYILGDSIGKGSFGKVKEGICSETLQRVAIKIINKKRLRRIPNGIENVLRELNMLRSFQHHNIIKIYDVYCKVENEYGQNALFHWSTNIENIPLPWTVDDEIVYCKAEIVKWYTVMEYCPFSIQLLIEKSIDGHLAIPYAHKYFKQLIDGLEYIHAHSIIHRDIKPGNLLINSEGELKITDFGIAEEFDKYSPDKLNVTTFAGTHQFLSPEVAEGLSSIDGEKVDIWAAAVTLYNMVSGKYPFEFSQDDDLIDLYDRISKAEYQMPEGIDDDLKDLFTKMLEKDPEKRLSIKEIKEHKWVKSYFPIQDGEEFPLYILSNLTDENNNDDDEGQFNNSLLKSLSNFKSLSKMNSRSTNIQNTGNSNVTDSGSSTSGSKHSKNSKKLFGLLKQKSKMGNSNIITDDKLKSINENEAISNNKINNANSQAITECEGASLGMLLSYDTTLIPYLKELFSKELEDELDEAGSIENSGLYAPPPDEKAKRKTWFKKYLK